MSRKTLSHNYHKGFYFTDSTGDCLTFALKKRCKNAIKRNSKRKHWARRCEINFLPVVHIRKSSKSQHAKSDENYNYLKCWKDIKGFGKCPELRPENETKDVICNPIRDNTKRCSTTHETVHTSCRVFEICDQAVMLSGGWNRETSSVRFKKNLAEFYVMLRNYGFRKRNIKIFYANGAYNFHSKCSFCCFHFTVVSVWDLFASSKFFLEYANCMKEVF